MWSHKYYLPKPPRPKAFLQAGLARPDYRYPDGFTVLGDPLERANDFLTSPELATVPAMTVLDEAGAPTLVMSRPHLLYHYLVAPTTEDVMDPVVSWSRHSSGMLNVNFGARRTTRFLEPAVLTDFTDSRPVTVDFSVVAAGFDRILFDARDAIFFSAALSLDINLVIHSQADHSPPVENVTLHMPWFKTTPLPLDNGVFRTFVELAAGAPLVREGAALDRTDLLCAATAIVYQSPLYTRKPEAYRYIKNGLKVLEYGPVRNKKLMREREANGGGVSAAQEAILAGPVWGAEPAGSKVAAEAASAADGLRAAYTRGDDFDAEASALMGRAAVEVGATEFVVWLLHDFMNNADPSWRIGLLEQAEVFAPAVRSVAVWHRDAMLLVSQVMNTIQDGAVDGFEPAPEQWREQELAIRAYGMWGLWPDDIGEDALAEIEDDPTNEHLLRWYRLDLVIAGIPEPVIDAEMAGVADGTRTPSRARIEQLRAEHGRT